MFIYTSCTRFTRQEVAISISLKLKFWYLLVSVPYVSEMSFWYRVFVCQGQIVSHMCHFTIPVPTCSLLLFPSGVSFYSSRGLRTSSFSSSSFIDLLFINIFALHVLLPPLHCSLQNSCFISWKLYKILNVWVIYVYFASSNVAHVMFSVVVQRVFLFCR